MKIIYHLVIIKRPILFFLIVACTIGCKKFVQIGPPTTQLATASVFSSGAAATAAQIAIYVKMFNESWNMAQAGGLLSDELTNYSTATTQLQYYANAMTALNGPGPWKNAYGYIYEANDIIARLQNNGNVPPQIAAQLIGEAKLDRKS